jgi:hypothetical protein
MGEFSRNVIRQPGEAEQASKIMHLRQSLPPLDLRDGHEPERRRARHVNGPSPTPPCAL